MAEISTALEQPVTPDISAQLDKSLLVEIAYEVCNQIGGIYTVIRSKVPSMQEHLEDRYCALGPYVDPNVSANFEHEEFSTHPFAQAAYQMREKGFEVHVGRWLITGRPITVLLNPYSVYHRLGEIKYLLWEHHHISTPGDDDLLNQVVAFGFMVKVFMAELANTTAGERPIIAHVHEWMAGTAIPEIRRDQLPVQTIFTTHATLLGRYLAMNDHNFYEHLPFYDWARESKEFNIETQTAIERAAAHGSHVFSTVSDVTARECEVLLGRKPDIILPNGLNIRRFSVSHEIQNIHQRFKEQIHQFVMGHFFSSYSFDLDNTLYFFTSGRFEYRNKGYDLTLEALARLNWRMKQANIDKTVVMFFITKQPYHNINPEALHSQALMKNIRETCEKIQSQIGDRLFFESATNLEKKLPDLNLLVDDYWRLRLRRNLQTWRRYGLPTVVTHNLINDAQDQILNFIRSANLVNQKDDRVKIIYHPDFISPTSPLLGMEYSDFVRGCHMGIFPSYYEPWGYTPLECIARGVQAITSDLAGFGDYYLKNFGGDQEEAYIINRKDRSYEDAASQLTDFLFQFVQKDRRYRIRQRYEVENKSLHFAWQNLTKFYVMAYELALQRL